MSNNKIIDGKSISAQIKDEIKLETQKLTETQGIIPGLAFILVGENPASQMYVRSKGKACEELGFYSITERLDENAPEEEVLFFIKKFNQNNKIHGILVQLPLPSHINEFKIIEAIDFRKDVDGFHPQNAGRLLIGKDCFYPCTPYGIVELLKRSGVETKGKNAVVIGRSNIVGKPVANLLLKKDINCTVSVCHSFTKDIKEHTLNADILIVAIGKPNFLTADMIKEGCTIIDVGINRIPDNTKKTGYRTVGDVDFEGCYEKCGKISPVPGGVGPMTIAMLMNNTLKSAKGEIQF
ncbi:MAG: bifunctional 5,10-methylenetetrahydrofolate dehydrogenase/5,10-methenyltetrahydrofolate cyclohydrolase [Ignavibacteria bacterium]|nr:bifunctional 5,10-methylenetetrahydrofolate dehydrogenase/5,10-methenyltetrahydrofolate cyclohydrolase [Ignavibacteria bacterium]